MYLRLAFRRILLGAGLFLSLGSCNGNTLGTFSSAPCTAGQKRCDGSAFQTCSSEGIFQTMQTCGGANVCDDALGCVACHPGSRVCANDNTEVHSCLENGTAGPTTTCDFGQACKDGQCIDACEVAASEFIYVVDDQNHFLSFEPRIDTDQNALKFIGDLTCSTNGATPFSMAVDRKARAWVLYDDGTIYLVNPKDASCTASSYVSGQMGFKRFGMGFVSDTAGSSNETLYIANNLDFKNSTDSKGMAKINPTTLALTKFADFPQGVVSSPELTGTGSSLLFGYFPSNVMNQHMIVQINRTSGAFDGTYQLTPLPNEPTAWAFAHWGGRYYQFVTTYDGTVEVNRILRYNPSTSKNDEVQTGTNYRIVGAGVSTCAPTTVG